MPYTKHYPSAGGAAADHRRRTTDIPHRFAFSLPRRRYRGDTFSAAGRVTAYAWLPVRQRGKADSAAAAWQPRGVGACAPATCAPKDKRNTARRDAAAAASRGDCASCSRLIDGTISNACNCDRRQHRQRRPQALLWCSVGGSWAMPACSGADPAAAGSGGAACCRRGERRAR
eukprot:363560-Chlamydomonas_euryale.AAC.11